MPKTPKIPWLDYEGQDTPDRLPALRPDRQFFGNSSREYALSVVPALESIGCDATAALTRPNPERDRALNGLDKQFYEIFEIEPQLFAFVESRAQAFVLGKMSVEPRPPKRGNRNLITLGVGLDFAPKTGRKSDAVRGELGGETNGSYRTSPAPTR